MKPLNINRNQEIASNSQRDQGTLANAELYKGLFEHMLEGFAYCRMVYEAGEPRDFIYLEVNNAFEKLTGLTGVRGKFVSEVIPGIRESNPELFEIYSRVVSTRHPEKFETYVEGLDIWFAISVYSPKPEHFVAVFENITERKQMEAALVKEQYFLHALLDAVPDYIYFKDTESRFIRTSKAHAKAFGLSDPALVIGKTDFDFFTGEHARQAYEDEQEIIRTGQPMSKEEKETWKDRPDTWVLTTKMPLRNRQGKIIGTFGISKDISERKQAEKDQLDYTAFLESLNYITRIVLEARDLESTLKALVENIAKLFRADDCYLALWDEVYERPVPMVAYGSMKDSYSQLVFDGGEHTLAASLMKSGHPLVIPDMNDSLHVSPKISSLFPNRTMLGLPLIVQDRKLAILYLGYNQSHSFSQKELRQAEIAAQQIALGMMKIQLLEESQKRVKQLTVLNEIAVLSTQVDTIDRLIESTTEIIGKNLFPDNFGVLLLDEEMGVLHAHPSYRFISNNALFIGDVPIGQGVTGQVAQTGQPVRIGNVEVLNNYINVDPNTASELCVPIRLKGRVLGVINAESTKAEGFSPDDELLLGTLAGQLATAIEQQRAAQAEREWLNQLAHSNELIYTIAHITTHIEKALTQEEIVLTLGRDLSKIGLTCCMATFDKKHSLFTVSYISLEPKTRDRVENSIGFPLVKHTFTLEKLNSILNRADICHPAAVETPEKEIQVLFPRQRKKRVPEILRDIGVGPEIELLRLPLVFEERLLGILWLWGKGITKADLPIMSIFAKQIGSSLERARLFQEVQSLALTDALTGLQNRRSLFELGRIEFARSKRMERPFCCLLLDVDHFKQINDNYGHPVGDQVLRAFAQNCKNMVRETDIIGRYGGEELVIFLPETDVETAVQVAERLRSAIEKTPITVSNRDVNFTISIGVAAKDENTLDLQTLVARADQAMYIAKYKGRNRVAISH
jgi:diguanylate cyclase (GGDEF)-like protein/PAS domain S-box-containing protein